MNQSDQYNPYEFNLEFPDLTYDRALLIQKWGSDAMIHLALGFIPNIGMEDLLYEHCPDFFQWLDDTEREFFIVPSAEIGFSTGKGIVPIKAQKALVVISVPRSHANMSDANLAKFSF